MKKLLFCILLILTAALNGQQCYEFDRYVDGNFFDTYTYCGDDLYIDLQDFSTTADLFYITPVNGLGYATGSQNVGNNQWRQFYKNVRVVPTSDITFSNFYFNTHDNWQSFNFTFSLEGTTLYCDDFVLQNFNYRDYFSMDCNAAISAEESMSFIYQGRTPTFNGTMTSPHIYVKNGNNTAINFGECCLLKADTLVLDQSAQNSVKIDGHVIAEVIESGANLQLQYDDAVLTVGELANNILIIAGENTMVNLCKNATTGADKIGYFKGDIFYNIDPATGWTQLPSVEGDINYNDYSSNYWTWKNSGKVPSETGLYASYDDCIDEHTGIVQYIIMEDNKIDETKDKITTYRKYNVLGQRISRNNGEVILEIKYGTPIKRCHTRQ